LSEDGIIESIAFAQHNRLASLNYSKVYGIIGSIIEFTIKCVLNTTINNFVS